MPFLKEHRERMGRLSLSLVSQGSWPLPEGDTRHRIALDTGVSQVERGGLGVLQASGEGLEHLLPSADRIL